MEGTLEHFCKHNLLYGRAVKVKRERKATYPAAGSQILASENLPKT